jgi:hypothetical protein
LLSTVKRSEYTEREKKLVDKIKHLKQENKKLVGLLKESEKILADKLKESQMESKKLNSLFKQLWPAIQSQLQTDPSLLKRLKDSTGVFEKLSKTLPGNSPAPNSVDARSILDSIGK